MACIGRWVTLASLLAVGAPVPPVPRKFVMRLPPFTFTKKLSRSEMRWSMRTGGRAVGRNRYFEIGGDQRVRARVGPQRRDPPDFLGQGALALARNHIVDEGHAYRDVPSGTSGFRISDVRFRSLSGKGLPEIRHPKSEIRNL